MIDKKTFLNRKKNSESLISTFDKLFKSKKVKKSKKYKKRGGGKKKKKKTRERKKSIKKIYRKKTKNLY